VGRFEIIQAVRSVYAQTGVERIQLLIGVDSPDKEMNGLIELIELLENPPEHVTPCLFYPGYSTSVRHGGLHPALDGGVLRSTLTFLANARYVAYLDDDNWWAPTHLQELLMAIRGHVWAFSLRWFVDPESRQPIVADYWESVGPGKGIFAQQFGGFVDPSSLMFDKIACFQCVSLWNIPFKEGKDADRHVYNFLQTQGAPGETKTPTTFYVFDPHDGLHALRQKYFSEGALRVTANQLPQSMVTDFVSEIQQALACLDKGQLFQAEEIFTAILEAQPDHSDALHMLGVIAYRREEFQRAVEMMTRAIGLNPANPAYYSDCGLALLRLNQLEGALVHYDKAIAINPGIAITHLNRGNVLHELNQREAALDSYDNAVRLFEKTGGGSGVFHMTGEVACDRGDFQYAAEMFSRAIKLNPDNAKYYSDYGLALHGLRQLDAAVENFDRAIAIKPMLAITHLNRGNSLKELRRFHEAVESFDNVIKIKPEHAGAHWNKALVQLLLGDFAKGWNSYEWRWKEACIPMRRCDFAQPLWLGGTSLVGKTILLHSEQGLGDTIQFSRYVGMVAGLGAKVVFEVKPALMALMKQLEGVAEVVVQGSALFAFDYHTPLLSLPLAFKTTLENIPSAQKYLSADAGKVKSWRGRLGRKTKPRIGLVWSGRASHENDHMRSVPLSELKAYLPDGFEYISLQKEVRNADMEELRSCTSIAHFGDELHDFSDTAALCELMDVVISVDTSV
ncbi:MAG: tetratricopeptide repeat protein, partial [Geobacteraceae bacterium]|nr:tetratricopeptide repeat protein [Geobacteraceae bacterium]